MHVVNWSGNICAVVTPFQKNGDLDEKAFCENLSLLMKEGIDGFVIAGHTGESWALEEAERLRIFELAAQTAAGRVTVIAGVSAIRTPEAVRLAKGAKERGVDGVMMTAPAYAMVNDGEVFAHVQAVAHGAGLPIMLYNIPRRVGRDIVPALVHKLTEIPEVAALKQSAPSFDELSETVRKSGNRLRIFAGSSAERGVPAAAVGVHGFLSSVEPQAMGEEAISLWRLSTQGQIEDARRVQSKTSLLLKALKKVGTDPAALKAVMNHLGRPGGYPRLPILPLTATEQSEVIGLVKDLVTVAP